MNLFGMPNPNPSSSSNPPQSGYPNQLGFPPTPEQFQEYQLFHQQHMLNMEFQNLQQNPPPYPQQEHPQTQCSQATTEPTPSSKRQLKWPSKKSKSPVSEKNPDVTGFSLRWQPVEETLVASCYVVVFEDRNVGVSQKGETLWNPVCPRRRVGILEIPRKTDAPDPVDLTEGDVSGEGHEELFVEYARPHPSGPGRSTQHMSTEFRLKREAAEKTYEVSKEKDRTLMHFEEMEFLATSKKDLSEDDAFYINYQKQLINDKYKLNRD
nr:hypothetical protein [Tanacetum cinerariifolium]